MEKKQISHIEWDGIDHSDYPDYCDAYIVNAKNVDTNQWLSIGELEDINEDRDLILELLNDYLN